VAFPIAVQGKTPIITLRRPSLALPQRTGLGFPQPLSSDQMMASCSTSGSAQPGEIGCDPHRRKDAFTKVDALWSSRRLKEKGVNVLDNISYPKPATSTIPRQSQSKGLNPEGILSPVFITKAAISSRR